MRPRPEGVGTANARVTGPHRAASLGPAVYLAFNVLV